MGTAKLRLRVARSDDEELVYRMICELENKELDRTSFNSIFQRNLGNDFIRYVIAEWDGEAVGIGSCHVQPLLHHAAMVAEIQEMFVQPAHRSKDIGRAIMEDLVAFAKSKSALQIEVTSNKVRENAHRFYEREGFLKSHVKLVRYF